MRQNNQSEKPSAVLQLAGGVVENMDNNMIGVDDGVSRRVIKSFLKEYTDVI